MDAAAAGEAAVSVGTKFFSHGGPVGIEAREVAAAAGGGLVDASGQGRRFVLGQGPSADAIRELTAGMSPVRVYAPTRQAEGGAASFARRDEPIPGLEFHGLTPRPAAGLVHQPWMDSDVRVLTNRDGHIVSAYRRFTPSGSGVRPNLGHEPYHHEKMIVLPHDGDPVSNFDASMLFGTKPEWLTKGDVPSYTVESGRSFTAGDELARSVPPGGRGLVGAIPDEVLARMRERLSGVAGGAKPSITNVDETVVDGVRYEPSVSPLARRAAERAADANPQSHYHG